MPMVAVAVAAAAASSAIATSAAVIAVVGTMGASILGAVVAGAISMVGSSIFAKSPKSNDGQSLTYQARDNKSMVRQPITAHRLIYGRDKVSGPITFISSTEDGNVMHLLLTVAAHEVDGFDAIYFRDEMVEFDAETHEALGKWSGKAWCWTGLGTDDGDADLLAALMDGCPDLWTANHRQSGRAKIYVRLQWDQELYASGIPDVRTILRGRKVEDIRTDSVGWSDNPALMIRDYLMSPYGFTATAAEIDALTFVEAANVCDEPVSVEAGMVVTFDHNVSQLSVLAFPGGQTGDRLRLSTTGQLPDGLSASQAYYWIRIDEVSGQLAATIEDAQADPAVAVEFGDNGAGVHTLRRVEEVAFTATAGSSVITLAAATPRLLTGNGVQVDSDNTLPLGLSSGVTYYWVAITETTGQLAETLDDARARIVITPESDGVGTHVLTRKTEPRYTASGTVDTAKSPGVVLGEMLTAMGGRLFFVGGKWRIYAAAWRIPVEPLDADDLDGPIKLDTRQPRRDLFNAVKGVFVSPDSAWQPTDYPPITSAVYEDQDGGERIWRADFDLPFTNSAGMAQRLARIELERMRRQMMTVWPCKLTAMRVQAGDFVPLNYSRFGWAAKTFEAGIWGFSKRGSEGAPVLGIDLTLREIDAAVFAWSAAEEVPPPAAPLTTLPDLSVVAAPDGIAVSDLPFGDAGAVSVVLGASAGPFLAAYQVEYLAPGAEIYSVLPSALDRERVIRDLVPGEYIFRGKALNTIGASSPYVATGHTVAVPSLVPRVAGLELVVDGAQMLPGGTEFTGPDAHFRWRDSSLTRPGTVDDDGSRDLYFQDFEIRVLTPSGDTLRVTHTLDPRYTYPHDQNALDTDAAGAPGPRRSFAIEVYQRGTVAGQVSRVPARIEVTNPAPALPTGVSLTAGLRQFFLRFTAPADLDWAGVLVWVGTSTGFAPAGYEAGVGNCVYRGNQTLVVLAGESANTYYVRFACFDRFGVDALVMSPEYVITLPRIDGGDLDAATINQTHLVDALSSRIDLIDAESSVPGSVAARIQSESTARTAADTALAGTIAAVQTVVDGNTASIESESTARAAADTALAGTIATVQTVVDGNTASIEVQQTTIDGLSAQYTVKVDVNGKVSGFGLASTAVDGEPLSEFAVLADRFSVASPGATGSAPFVVSGGRVYISGGELAPDSVTAGSISVDALSAVSADLGVVTTGALVSTNSRMVVDLDTQRITGAGPGGQAADDYWLLDADGLSYYRWDGAAHLLYKALSRTEAGVADSGDTVTLPGYWAEEPTILVSPYSLSLYDPAYAAQRQKVRLDYGGLTETAPGQWSFQPVAHLELDSGSGATVVNDSYTGASNTDSSAVVTTPANCTNITIHVALRSVRGTGTAPNYYKRSVQWRVGYRVHGSGSAYTYTSWQTKAMPVDGLYAVSDQRGVTLPSAGTWDALVEYAAADVDGTFFAYGSGGYNYNTASMTGTNVSWSAPIGSAGSGTSVYSYTPPAGWEVYNVAYSYTLTHTTTDWQEFMGEVATKPITGPGFSETLSSRGHGADTATYSHTVSYTAGGVQNITVTAGVGVRFAVSMTLAGSATVYIRQPITNSSTADNTFTWESYDYTLSSAEVLATGSVLWTATGR